MNEEEQMLASVLNCRRADLFRDKKEMNSKQKEEFKRMRSRRKNGEPLQYIIGDVDFFGLSLKVDERVLIPRPETEILVEYVLDKIKNIKSDQPLNILDLGTGSGNISISLAKFLKSCRITSVDISKDALDVAGLNAKENLILEKIDFVNRDMAEFLLEAKTNSFQYDIIVSNPPYIPTTALNRLPVDVRKEPMVALNGGIDGMRFIRGIIKNSYGILKDGGFLAIEIGDGQYHDIINFVKVHSDFDQAGFVRDYVGTERIVVLEKR